jgi:hypothetical protein
MAFAYVATSGSAQATDSAEFRCDGRRVSAIDIRTEPPLLVERSAPRWLRPVLRAALQSPRTESSAIAPFVLVAPGATCSELLRRESERLLRGRPYLADARVTALPDPDGTVRLVVETTDDIALVVGGAVRDGEPRRVLLGNANVGGLGLLAAGEWERGFAYRTGLGVHLAHGHVFGRREAARLDLVRAPLRADYVASLARPYLTDVQAAAWWVGYARTESYLPYQRSGTYPLSLYVARDVVGASALTRLGGGRRRLLAGASVAHERIEPARTGVVVTDTGFASDPLATRVASSFSESRATRAAVVAGGRWLGYRTMEGVDAVAGRQDVATGVQLLSTLGVEFGRERPAGAAPDVRLHEPFASADLYAGVASARGLTALGLLVEGERASGGDWRDVVVAGRVGWYRKASARRTHVVGAEYAGAWRERRPYRLAIGGWLDGARGYSGSNVTGGRLAVLRLEERLAVGGVGRLLGLGVAGFGDVAKMWAGDVPFGVTTRPRASVGTGLLLALPRRSQGFFRVDAAARLTRDVDAKPWTLRISRALPYTTFWRDPSDLSGARAPRPSAALAAVP